MTRRYMKYGPFVRYNMSIYVEIPEADTKKITLIYSLSLGRSCVFVPRVSFIHAETDSETGIS